MEQSTQLKRSVQLQSHLMASDQHNWYLLFHSVLLSTCLQLQHSGPNVCVRTVYTFETDLLSLIKKEQHLLGKVQDFLI